jgi:PAS domain S-box-containing protein
VTGKRTPQQSAKAALDGGSAAPAGSAGAPSPHLRPSSTGFRRAGSSQDSRPRARAQLAERALEARDLDELLDSTVSALARSLHAPCCAVFSYEPARRMLRLRAGTGWAALQLGTEIALADEPAARVAMERGVAVVRPAGRRAPALSPLLRSCSVENAVFAAIAGRSEPCGVVGVFGRRGQALEREEQHHLRAAGRLLGLAWERLVREQERCKAFEQLQGVCQATAVVGSAQHPEEVYEHVERILRGALGLDRLALLVAEPDGFMRVKASHGLSRACLEALELCSPWSPGTSAPKPVQGFEVLGMPALALLRSALEAEGVRSVSFVPLVFQERSLGSFVLCHDAPRVATHDELRLAETFASHVAFAIGRMRAEEALRQSEERLRMVVGNAAIVLFATDREGVFTLSEGKGLNALGMKPGSVVGLSAFEMYRDVPQICADLERALAGESFVSVVEVSGLVFETWYRPLRDAAGRLQGVMGVATDMTDRLRAEAALRRSEEKYRRLFEHANDVIFVIDPDSHRLLKVNEKAVQRLGYSHDEFRRMTLDQICPILQKGGVAQVAETAKARGSLIFEHRHRCKDGTEIPVETSSQLVEYGGRKVLLHFVRDITERKRADDALRRAHEELEQRVRDRTANLLAAYERLEREIQERRRVEERIREREAELAHVTRLSTMGEMAATMAHELNQPLAAIANYAGGCLRRLQAGSASEKHLLDATEQITAQAQRAGRIIHRLRSFVRKREPRRTLVDVNDAVREAVSFSTPEARRYGVAVALELADTLPAVLADLVQVEQVILNLLRNGIEAMRGMQGGKRLLEVKTTARDDWVEVAIRDWGCGVPAEAAGRLFHPFFTTKPHGMGMGLAISQSIVSAHGGRIWTHPAADGGAVFRFTLPVARDSGHGA